MTLRKLFEWAMTGKYDLDRELRFEMLWTDFVKEYLPKEEVLYMPVNGMKQYDWGIVFGMGEKEVTE